MTAIKAELSKRKIPKSGKNKYSGFTYHELQDFMPHILELNNKHGVASTPQFLKDKGICTLKLVNVDDSTDSYTVVIPFVEAEMLAKGGAPSTVDAIQRIGSTITYNRRYLFMTAYDVVESDAVEKQIQNTKTINNIDIDSTLKKLENQKDIKSLAEMWENLSGAEKANPQILAKKEELKNKLK